MISKQYDSLNYSLEMHKVRKNKKADFDIYNLNELDIEDKDIDKCIIYNGWKDLTKEEQNFIIDNYTNLLFIKYKEQFSIDYIKLLILNNINKIKYDKKNRCINNLSDLIYINNNIETKLYIKKTNNKDSHISKLRKSLKRNK